MIFQKFLLLPTTTFFLCIYSLGFLPNNTKNIYSTDLLGGIHIYWVAIAFLNSTQYEEYFEMKIFCFAPWKKKLEHSVALNIAYFSMKSHEIPKIWAKKAVIFQKFGHLNPSHPFPYYMTVTTPCWHSQRLNQFVGLRRCRIQHHCASSDFIFDHRRFNTKLYIIYLINDQRRINIFFLTYTPVLSSLHPKG